MKKFFKVLMVALFAIGTAMAQENEKLYFNNVLNNRFGDNWEITLGGGMNYSAYDGVGFDQGKFFDNTGWNIELTTTKWFNPVIGARVQVIGGELQAMNEKSWYVAPHADAVVNLSNWIGGYRDDRVYYANVFAGVGANVVDIDNDHGAGPMGVVGLNNVFRVSPSFDINLELKSLIMEGDDMPRVVADNGKVGQIYSATVGLTYRFNKRTWDAGVKYADAVAYMSMIDALNRDLDDSRKHVANLNDRMRKYDDTVKRLAKDNKDLRDQIKNHKCNVRLISTSVVYFDFDSYEITDKSEVALDALASVIKNSNNDQKFTITGHADSQTGTNEYNQKLSEKRAEAVYNYLIEKGVDKNKLSWVGNGPTNAYHKSPRANRLAFIK